MFCSTKLISSPCYAPRITDIIECNNSIQINFDPYYSYGYSEIYLEVSSNGNWGSFGTILKDTLISTSNSPKYNVKLYDLPIGSTYHFRLSFLGGVNSCAYGQGRFYYHPSNANIDMYSYITNRYRPLKSLIISDYKCDSIKIVWNMSSDSLFNVVISDNSAFAGSNTKFYTNLKDTILKIHLNPGLYRYIRVISLGTCGSTMLQKSYLKPGINYQVDAGPDIVKNYDTSVLLNGTNPGNSVFKRWRLISSTKPYYLQDSTISSPIFRGKRGGKYVLEYRIKVGFCEVRDTLNFSIFICGDTIIDVRDGNKYPTVLISKVCWTAKNLNYGTFITTATLQASSGAVNKYCLDNLPGNCDSLGGLYQWNNVRRGAPVNTFTQGVCPVGWHVSSEAEAQNSLITAYTGSQYRAGGISGFEWKCKPTWDADLSMFSSSDCGNIYTTSIWWVHMTYNNGAGWYNGNPNHAFPMRCVKDNY